MRAPLLALLLLAAGPAAAQTYDGQWSVDVDVRSGGCPEGRSFPVRISGGRLFYDGNLDIGANGTIATDGRVTARFTRGQEYVAANGRLASRSGSGQWRAPTRDCTGTWRARRL